MLDPNMSKQEIEAELVKKGDYVKIDYLTRLLKEKLPLDRRKFVCEKLAEIYANKGMFIDAAKMYNNVAISCTNAGEKMNYHAKEAEMYIKGGSFDFADEAVKKASSDASSLDRVNLNIAVKEIYKKQAGINEKEKRRSSALRIYEKLLQMNLTDGERQEIKAKLVRLYEQLGKVKEYFTAKQGVYNEPKKLPEDQRPRKKLTMADLGLE